MASKYDEYEKILYGSGQTQQNQNTINNLSARLAAGGVDPNEALDTRNWLEKGLNLKQDQNFLFDIFEILNRPQQALFGGIENYQQGGDFLEGAKQGITGNKDTQFKDILMNTGRFEDREGKLDLVDALGFAGDVFLDPTNIPVIPGLKAGGKLASLDDLVGMGIKKGVKGTVGLADKGITKGLAALDKTKGVADDFGNIVKLAYDDTTAKRVADLGSYVTNKADLAGKGAKLPKGRLEKYLGIKEDLTNLFKVSEPSKQAILKGREINANVEEYKKQVANLLANKNKNVEVAAKQLTKEGINMSADDLSKKLMLLSESNLNRSATREELLKIAKNGKLKANENTINALQDLLMDIPEADRAGLDLAIETTKSGKIKLGKDWSNARLQQRGLTGFNPETLAGEVSLGDLPENVRKEVDELKELYNTNATFKNIADDIIGDRWVGGTKNSLIDELNSLADETLGSNLSGAYDPASNVGYAPHTMNFSWDEIKDYENIPEGMLKGNTGVLADRELLGTARELNDMWGEQLRKNYDTLDDAHKAFVDTHDKLFEENYLKAAQNRYFDQLPSTLKENKLVNDILIDQTFGSKETLDRVKELQKKIYNSKALGEGENLKELTKEYQELTKDLNIKFLTKYDNKVPSNMTLIEGNTLKDMKNKLKKIGSQLGTEDKIGELLDTISKQKGKIAMDNNVLRMLQVSSDPKQMNSLTRAYSSWLNHFKKWKTASPTFLMNNLVGNSSNLYLGGINYTEQAMLGPKVADIITNGEKYANKLLNGETLTKAQREVADNWNLANKLGIMGGKGNLTALNVQDMPESVLRYFRDGTKPVGKEWLKDALPYFNNLANQKMDAAARLTVMLKAAKDPSYIKSLGIKTAGSEGIRDAVAKVMFDPDMLTDFERNTMKKIVPFYTYAKNNLVYHLDNMGQNLGRYEKTMQGIKSLQDAATDGNSDEMADYLKNSLYIPIPGLGKNGEYKLLRANLPFGQILELADDPLKELTNMTSPLVKAPIELALNKQLFNDLPIEKFPGQQGNIDLLNNLPGPLGTARGQYILSNLSGLDVPIKTLSRLGSGTPSEAILMNRTVDADRLSKTYDQIEDLQNLMSQYGQKGYKFSTMTELKKANKNGTIEGIDAIFAKYGITSNNNSTGTYDDYERILYGR